MTGTATVRNVTRRTTLDATATPYDVVQLTCDGETYFWSAPPGTYTVGQEIAVQPSRKTVTVPGIEPADC